MTCKICVISMQFGFTGLIPTLTGFSTIVNTHNRCNQFILDPNKNYSEQISEFLNRMIREASEYHDRSATLDKGMGIIISHDMEVIDHHE